MWLLGGTIYQAGENDCTNTIPVITSVGVLWGDLVYDPHKSGKKKEWQ